MSEADERRPKIVVRDRRPFAADGTPRPGVERSEPSPEAAASGASSTPAPQGPGPSGAHRQPGGGPAGPAASPQVAPGTPRRDDPRFLQLVTLLATHATSLLDADAAAGPGAATKQETLRGIETFIGMFEALQAKAGERLGETEKRVLSQALYGLRMAYMDRAPAAAPAKKTA